jgi:hypothetical protein
MLQTISNQQEQYIDLQTNVFTGFFSVMQKGYWFALFNSIALFYIGSKYSLTSTFTE